MRHIKPPSVAGVQPEITCQIGINHGLTFVAEIGERRGRREFNVLGDTVITTARLKNKAGKDQVLVSEAIQQAQVRASRQSRWGPSLERQE